MNLKNLFKEVAGREASDDEIKKIISIANNCDMSFDDPLFPWFVAQEIYHQSFSKMPERLAKINNELEQAALKAAKTAADASTARVNVAIENCIPELAKASGLAASHAAERAVSNVEHGRSSISIFLGMISNFISVFFGALLVIIWEKGELALFAQSIGTYIFVGLGGVTASTLILYLIRFDESSYKSTFQNFCLVISILGFIAIISILALQFI
jgi:hypothetical protein